MQSPELRAALAGFSLTFHVTLTTSPLLLLRQQKRSRTERPSFLLVSAADRKPRSRARGRRAESASVRHPGGLIFHTRPPSKCDADERAV